MDLFFLVIVLGLFALIVAELTARLLASGLSWLRPDWDPEVLVSYISRIATPVITTSGALVLMESVGDIVLLAGAAAAVTLLAWNWTNRQTVVVPSAGIRRR